MQSHTSGALASSHVTTQFPTVSFWQAQAIFPDGRVAPLYGNMASTKGAALHSAADLIQAFPKDFAGALPGAVPQPDLPPTVLVALVHMADGSLLRLEGSTFDNAADCMEYARTWAEAQGLDYVGVGNRRVVLALEGLR